MIRFNPTSDISFVLCSHFALSHEGDDIFCLTRCIFLSLAYFLEIGKETGVSNHLFLFFCLVKNVFLISLFHQSFEIAVSCFTFRNMKQQFLCKSLPNSHKKDTFYNFLRFFLFKLDFFEEFSLVFELLYAER